jgi:hypothetical protein
MTEEEIKLMKANAALEGGLFSEECPYRGDAPKQTVHEESSDRIFKLAPSPHRSNPCKKHVWFYESDWSKQIGTEEIK